MDINMGEDAKASSICLTLDSLFDVESYLNKIVGVVDYHQFNWYVDRMDASDYRKCAMNSIFNKVVVLSSNLIGERVIKIIDNVLTDDMRAIIIEQMHYVAGDMVRVNFVSEPDISDVFIARDIIYFAEKHIDLLAGNIIGFSTEILGNKMSKNDVRAIKELTACDDVIPIDGKYFREEKNDDN